MSDSMAERMAKLRLEAVNAFEATDYATALLKIDAMRIIYDTTPNSEKDGLQIEWRSIEGLTKRLEQLISRSDSVNTGILRRIPVTTGAIDGLERDEWGS